MFLASGSEGDENHSGNDMKFVDTRKITGIQTHLILYLELNPLMHSYVVWIHWIKVTCCTVKEKDISGI